jgi:polysaccharide pyruvyl transferase WcaK-like protein
VRLHLGHHFYGAGNLGDDFMLAGFLRALRTLRPDARLTANIPFPLAAVRARTSEVDWQPYELALRQRNIQSCDAWLGLGGSPFQSALSRWFIDHLVADAEICRATGKPMYFLGVGVQGGHELDVPEVRQLCGQAAAIWTRDSASAAQLRQLPEIGPVAAAADLAHIFFQQTPPPRAQAGRVTLVPNFDYGVWTGRDACLRAVNQLDPAACVWLAQESRELPGAEITLHAALPEPECSKWQLVSPDVAGAPLAEVLDRWPSGEWLITSRFHAAIAGAWAGSKVVVIGINEKLRSIARDLDAPLIEPDADEPTVLQALRSARPSPRPATLAQQAWQACEGFARSAVAPDR